LWLAFRTFLIFHETKLMKSQKWLVVCVSVVLFGAGRVMAQADRPLDDIPLEVRTADRLTDVHRQEIHQYISGWVGVLQDNSNPQQQGMAREKLTNGIIPVGTETVSNDYQNEYSKEINDALLPLIKSDQMRVRLLAGIVAGRVAERTGNIALLPIATGLLNDKNDAVLLWGMRVGRYVLPSLLRTGLQNSPLGQQMADVVHAHPEIPLANDAYDAADLPPEAGGPALQAAAEQTLLLLRTRVNVYTKACPVDPQADSTGTTFLTIRAWGALPPEQRFEATQEISDLLSVMAQRCLVDGSDHMARSLAGLQPVAGAIDVIGTDEQAQDVVNAAKPVAQQRFSPQTPPQQIMDLVAKIYPALVAVPDFSKLKAPPSLQTSATTQR
jgi:hypothetical protein